MNKAKIFSILTSVLFFFLIVLKQYWLVDQLNMKFSNEYHMITSLSLSFLLFSILFLFKSKHRILGIIILDFFFSLLLFVDLVYYRYFSDFITIPVLFQSGQAVDIKDSIFYLIHLNDFTVFLSIPIWILCFIFKKHFLPMQIMNIKKRFICALISFVIGAYMMYFPTNAYIQKNGSALFEQSYSNASVYRVIGIAGFHGLDVKKYVEKNFLNKKSFSKEELSSINNWFGERQELKKKDSHFGIAKDKNIIVFQFESLQAFVIGKTVEGQEITPNLNKLVKEDTYFTNIFDQTGQGRTSDAEILVNASLHPLQTGSVHVLYPTNTFDSIANNLKGYGAYSFHGNNKSFWNRYLAHESLGFDKFYSLEELKDDERMGPFLSDGSLLKQASSIISQKKEPFYSFIVGVSSHHPFNFAKGKSDLPIGKLEGTELGDYLQAVHYVDSQVGEFIDDLKQRGLWEKTIFITYGDHNTQFVKEDPITAEFLGMDMNSTEYYLEDMRIPLIMHVPGSKVQGEKVETYGGLIDTAPTLFHLLGKEKPKYMFGHNLFTTSDNSVVLRNGGFINQNHYFDNSNGNQVCYDLNTMSKTMTQVCNEESASLLKNLEMSDKVIQNNLIGKLKEIK